MVANLRNDYLYRAVFDPFNPEDDPDTASISDDLSDIYCDLQKGLVTLQESRVVSNNVIWQWKFDLQIHWGRHAVSVMRALHALAFEGMKTQAVKEVAAWRLAEAMGKKKLAKARKPEL